LHSSFHQICYKEKGHFLEIQELLGMIEKILGQNIVMKHFVRHSQYG